ncbi:MAG: tyrosine-type recombinase/integrase [Pseudonocardiaceae bacterium]
MTRSIPIRVRGREDAGTLRIEGTVIRIPGQGLTVRPHTKWKAGMRTITPPGSWTSSSGGTPSCTVRGVFPTTRLTLRDPDNTRARRAMSSGRRRGKGLHLHAFRHPVATRLDRAGLSAREIADYLGHERVSMTQGRSTCRYGPGSTWSARRSLSETGRARYAALCTTGNGVYDGRGLAASLD